MNWSPGFVWRVRRAPWSEPTRQDDGVVLQDPKWALNREPSPKVRKVFFRELARMRHRSLGSSLYFLLSKRSFFKSDRRGSVPFTSRLQEGCWFKTGFMRPLIARLPAGPKSRPLGV